MTGELQRPRRPDPVALAKASPRRCWLILYSLFFAVLLGWGIGTPLQQSPDEWSHLFRAAGIYHGEILDSAPGPMDPVAGDPLRVPAALNADRLAARCFMHHNTVPVSCSHPRSTPGELVTTSTPSARYPPFYYAFVGWPLLFGHGPVVLYAMRVVSAAISAAFLAWGLLASLRLGAGLAATGVLVAVTPMAAWLSTMINPNGLEIAAAVGLWPNLALWVSSTELRHRRAGLTGAAVSAVAMVLSRSVSVIWVCVAVVSVLPLLRGGWLRQEMRTRYVRLAVAGVLLAGMMTLGWSVVSRQTQLAALHSSHFTAGQASLGHNLLLAVGQLGAWWHQSVGNFGWLDTPIDGRTLGLFNAGLVTLGLVAACLALRTGRIRALAAAVIAALLAIATTLYLSASVVNQLSIGFWQGRYSLPMWVGVPVLLGLAVRDPGDRFRRIVIGTVALVSSCVVVVTLSAYLTYFRRNSVGVRGKLTLTGGWQPPGDLLPWLVLLTGGLVGLAAIAVAAASGGSAGWQERQRERGHADIAAEMTQ